MRYTPRATTTSKAYMCPRKHILGKHRTKFSKFVLLKTWQTHRGVVNAQLDEKLDKKEILHSYVLTVGAPSPSNSPSALSARAGLFILKVMNWTFLITFC